MENNDPIINGLVYRDDDKFIFVSFYDEKKKEIFETQYQTLGTNKHPISEECFVLVNFREECHRIKTVPIIITRLHYNNKDIAAKKISLDGLITSAYEAAKKYLILKTESSDSELLPHHSNT